MPSNTALRCLSGGASVGLADRVTGATGRVLHVPAARWLRFCAGVLEVGDAQGTVQTLLVPAEELTLVGPVLSRLAPEPADGALLCVAARFPEGAAVLIERRGERIAVAASPLPSPHRPS